MNKARVLQLAAAIAASNDFNMGQHMTCAIGHAQEIAEGKRLSLYNGGWGARQMFKWLEIDPSTLPENGGALWNPIGYENILRRPPDLPDGMYLSDVPKELAARVFEHFAETGEINWRI